MKRFLVILLNLILYTTLFTSCPGRNTGANSEAEKPKEIRVLLADHPYGNLLIPLIPEFEKETGIKVILEQLKENELNSRLTEDFNTGNSAADVFMTRPIQETLFFLKNDWIAPIENYDFSDYPQNTVEIGLKDGKLHVVPLIVEWQVLF
ncbi:MAG: extracellular solute-binding protein, partial [Treponema sp.]|nr:extracellular solute-binding protein [Treponema sp.]